MSNLAYCLHVASLLDMTALRKTVQYFFIGAPYWHWACRWKIETV